jgi:hypothetical protein
METNNVNVKYISFLNSYNYLGLLEYTNQILSDNKNDKIALEYKAKALISLQKYEEANHILSKISFTPKLQTLERITHSLVNFRKSYEKAAQNCLPNSWYENRLKEEIQKFKEYFVSMNDQHEIETYDRVDPYKSSYEYYYNNIGPWYMDLHKFALEKNHEVYILGPEKIVNKFSYYDYGTSWSLRSELKFPFAQGMHDGWLFTKEQNYLLPYGNREEFSDGGPICIAPFPVSDYHINPEKFTQKDQDCDVFYSDNLIDETTHNMIKHTLDDIAKETMDYFVPMYHNIIDPNLTAVEQSGIYQWTATDFIIEEVKISTFNTMCSLQLCLQRKDRRLGKYIIDNITKLLQDKKIPKAHIASPISNISLDKVELYVATEQILNAALPLLSKLTKPALLFPGKLQAVVKAQRIYLKPGEEYDGIWHRDGKHENIVAVVIYYYRVSEQLIGGDLEFIDKRPIKDKFGLYGDCGTQDFTTEQAKAAVKSLPQCKIPVQEGTLVVFSNYQNIHRVLKMTCEGKDPTSPDGYASRDFLLFFIVDLSKPLQSTSINLDIKDDRIKVREILFRDQMQPSGIFVPNTGLVSSTGNGALGQVGWLDGIEDYNFSDDDLYFGRYSDDQSFRIGFKIIEKMNKNPPMTRGLSWAFDSDSDSDYEYDSHLN